MNEIREQQSQQNIDAVEEVRLPKRKGFRTTLIVLVCVLGVALIGAGYMFYRSEIVLSPDADNFVIDDFKLANGLTVNGIDLSNKTATEARELIYADVEKKLKETQISISVIDAEHTFSAQDLGIVTDVDEVVEMALAFANSGDYDKRKSEQEMALSGNANFNTKFIYDNNDIKKLTEALEDLNVAPRDASAKFNPKEKNKFTYEKEVVGYDIDLTKLAGLLLTEVDEQRFNKIDAPVTVTQPKITEQMLKENTVQLGSYSTDDLGIPNRVYNIKKLSGMINGVVIMPGETWSINEEAGPRKNSLGWRDANGITGGRFEMQAGGGVCQVSTTLYNAAIRSELEIVERIPHSIPSTYVPIGLDATINTGGQDLKLKNPYEFPVYIESYVSGDKVYASIYGPKFPPEYDKVDFTSKRTGSISQPAEKVIEATKTPDGKAIPPGESVVWVKGRAGQKAIVTKTWYKDGKAIKREQFGGENTYRSYQQVVYHNPAAITQ